VEDITPQLWAFYRFGMGKRGDALGEKPVLFHDGDGQPDVDQVLMKVLDGGADAGWSALQDGACDALDASFRLASEPELLATIEAAGAYELRVTSGEAWTQLVFGVSPAEYDTLNNPIFAQRPDYFGDVRTRQGVAACLDRQAMAALTTGGWAAPWPSFASPEESRLGEGVVFNPEAGAALLDQAGWIDHDGDPSTPRRSRTWSMCSMGRRCR
jgi:ABC-type transport system substrate-binding protein